MLLVQRRPFAAIALAAFLASSQSPVLAQQNPAPTQQDALPPSPAKPDAVEIPLEPLPPSSIWSDPTLPAVKIPNYVTCPIAELQRAVPDLARLKVAQNQAQLSALLDKIGAETEEIVRRTPNLISHETVVSEQGRFKTVQNFSFLVLQHARDSSSMIFDEYRVDVETGKKFQTEEAENATASEASPASLRPLETGPLAQANPQSGMPPVSEGFANDWLHFYPGNRPQSAFRYLGQLTLNGQQTLIVAFAQKPGSVPLPKLVAVEGKSVPVFMQGVAWVDASDFRIVRLRTDLLTVPPGVPLRQLTADIQFRKVSVAEIPAPLWLPRRVVVTTNLAGVILREIHTYSDHRLFRTSSRIVLNP